jgi:hypothetical protein
VFIGPDGVTPQPFVFGDVAIVNRATPVSLELMFMYRMHQCHDGATLEWLLGPRYFYFRDYFALGSANVITADNIVRSEFELDAKNRIAGPQIGLRWFRPFGRAELSMEGRFMAGLNNQITRERGALGGSTITNPDGSQTILPGSLVRRSTSDYEFTPLAEFRIEAHFQMTRLIMFKAGWNFIYMDNIARASGMVDYRLPALGVVQSANKQDVIMQGLNLGIEVNR